MVGARIRDKRQAQQRSLADVAGEAGVSVATLSRIENDKQTLDLELFLSLARVLKSPPQSFLDGDGEKSNMDTNLVSQIAALASRDRAQLWQDLAMEQRAARSRSGREDQQLGSHVDELLDQLDLFREELEAMKKRLRRR